MMLVPAAAFRKAVTVIGMVAMRFVGVSQGAVQRTREARRKGRIGGHSGQDDKAMGQASHRHTFG